MVGAPSPRIDVKVWPPSYAVARLTAVPAALPATAAGPPVALIVGAGEVSLLAPEELVDSLGECVKHASRGWRAITLDAVLPLDATGVMAAVGRALADVGVPVMALSSHDTDHFLVPGHQLGRALAALRQIRLERILAPG